MVPVPVPPLGALAHRLVRAEYPTLRPAGEPAFGLPAAPATRYARRLARLAGPERARLGAAVATAIDRAGEPIGRYLRRAFAAGHPPAAIERLASAWAGREPDWLRRHVGRFDPPEPGPVRHHDGRLTQCDRRTCGPSVVVVARTVVDPAYAYQLATGPAAAFGAAQLVVHRAANLFWPRALGTTPMGVNATMNVHSGSFGARYGWRPVDPARPESARAAVGAALRAAGYGWPVPLLIGRWEPRHWVLVVGAAHTDLLCYEPGRGRVVSIPADEVAAGRADPLGYPYLHAVVLPVDALTDSDFRHSAT